MKKENILNLVLMVIVGVLVVVSTVQAATTISTNIVTEGTLSVAGASTLATTTISDLTVSGKTNGVKVYRALLTQTGTNAPLATVLENSLGGTVVWTRSDVGTYAATLAGAFPAGKVHILVGSPYGGATLLYGRTSDDALWLTSNSLTINFGAQFYFLTLSEERLNATSIEIRVFP